MIRSPKILEPMNGEIARCRFVLSTVIRPATHRLRLENLIQRGHAAVICIAPQHTEDSPMARTRRSSTIIPAAANVPHARRSTRGAVPWWRRIAATTAALMCLLGVPTASVHAAGCTVDGQSTDDLPGQKDLNQFCNNGACGGGISYTWSFDDTDWNGNNTGDSCALYDTDNDGFANRVVCVTVEAGPAQQAGNPKCYTCNDDAPDRCNGSVLVACTSVCTLQAQVTDPFTGASGHESNKCNGPNCETKDTQTSCCITAGDTGGGFLLDTCSYPSQQPNSAPSDCIVNPPSCSTNADCGLTMQSEGAEFGCCDG